MGPSLSLVWLRTSYSVVCLHALSQIKPKQVLVLGHDSRVGWYHRSAWWGGADHVEILWIAIRTTVLGRRQDRMAYCTGTTEYHLDLYR